MFKIAPHVAIYDIIYIISNFKEKIILKFVNSNENNFVYLLLTRGRKNKWILIGIVYWARSNRLRSWVSSSRLGSLVHHAVGDVKLDAQEKLFVLTTFSGFIGLC